MAKTRSMTRNQSHDDDASSSFGKKRFKTFDRGDAAPWSNLNHDVLFIILMQLGFVDFFAFSKVCKSWRSVSLSNRNMFMVSKPPMKICIQPHDTKEDTSCYLEDYARTRIKTILPYSAGRSFIRLTCGYLILFGGENRDFWLVNPITRHELHFPDYPLDVGLLARIKGILVFSPSISGWMFVMLNEIISYSIAGKRGWNHVSSTLPIIDLHFFKGKIYTLHNDCCLGQLRLDPKSKLNGKWTLLETKNFPKPGFFNPLLVSSIKHLYVMNWVPKPRMVMELDFGEMKWVWPEKTIEEYAFFASYFKSSAAIKQESFVGIWMEYKSNGNGYFLDIDESGHGVFCYAGTWYFPHDCLNVNHLNK